MSLAFDKVRQQRLTFTFDMTKKCLPTLHRKIQGGDVGVEQKDNSRGHVSSFSLRPERSPNSVPSCDATCYKAIWIVALPNLSLWILNQS